MLQLHFSVTATLSMLQLHFSMLQLQFPCYRYIFPCYSYNFHVTATFFHVTATLSMLQLHFSMLQLHFPCYMLHFSMLQLHFLCYSHYTLLSLSQMVVRQKSKLYFKSLFETIKICSVDHFYDRPLRKHAYSNILKILLPKK